MSLAKYSPTVNYWYAKDPNWFEKNGGNDINGSDFTRDKDGYDSYGYNKTGVGVDRAGNSEFDYENYDDETCAEGQLYEDVAYDYVFIPVPKR